MYNQKATCREIKEFQKFDKCDDRTQRMIFLDLVIILLIKTQAERTAIIIILE